MSFNISEINKTDFSVHNIPFGIVKHNGQYLVSTRLGDSVITLSSLIKHFPELAIPGLDAAVLENKYLNDFIALGKKVTVPLREKIQNLLISGDTISIIEKLLIPTHEVEVCMPLQIGDYTDFYSSLEHATNVGKMFRDPNNPLLPNWKHMPIGYHGRASSIVISGTNVKRPSGQYQINEGEAPQFGPSRTLDIELEMGFVIGKENKLGEPININNAEEHIFGMMLFNDWSARDLQRWEYVPLGPFLGKNFASTISPWIVTLEALDPFRTETPKNDVEVLDYLKIDGKRNYDINLEVDLITADGSTTTICHSNFKYMYWNMCQQLAHHTVNGCNMRVGDVCASGTISGPTEDSFGSMMELSWKGTKPIKLTNGEERKFLQNGDSINLRGFAEKDGVRVGFGDCLGKIV